MEQRRGFGTVLAGMLLLAVFFGGCGSPEETMTAASGAVVSSTTATAGVGACASCHTGIAAEWLASRHANINPGESLDSLGTPTTGFHGHVPATDCTRCHDPNGDSNAVALISSLGTTARPIIGCEACHGPGSLHAASGGSGPISLLSNTTGTTLGTIAVSAQFRMCTNCHELLDPATGAQSGLLQHNAFTTSDQYIWDTHYATPSSWSSSYGSNNGTAFYAVSGYSMDFAEERVCVECHNPHGSARNNQEWAASAHGDRTSPHKDPQGYFSGAWSYYNWSCDGTSSDGCGAAYGVPNNRAGCQRCHSTTGFRKYADALRTGDAAAAEAIRLGTVSSLTYTSTFKPEMLKCGGCHTDNRGTLRNPGAVTAVYMIGSAAAPNAVASSVFPDVNESNVCLACHTGLQNGDALKQVNSQAGRPAIDFNNQSFINSHYLTAGGTVFTTSGYEYEGRPYDNPASYQHSSIGVLDFRSTGTDGPCVGCHMSRPNGNGNHLFMPVTRFNPVRYNAGAVDVTAASAVVTGVTTTWNTAGIDPASDVFHGPDGRSYGIASVDGATQITLSTPYAGSTAAGQIYVITRSGDRITGIASELCFNCHAGSTNSLVAQLNEERTMYLAALEALKFFLDKKKFCFIDAYPYFNQLRVNDGTVSVANGSPTVTGSGTLFSSGTSSVNAATDRFRAYDGNIYEIRSVDSDTQLTLKTSYLGPDVAGSAYAVLSAANVKDWDPDDKGGANGGTLGKNNMGAAFNFNLLGHDPGAYVHNRTYVKRLLYDSLDWIDDNKLNYSAGASLSALASGLYDWKSGAVSYLLPNGVLGIAAERP